MEGIERQRLERAQQIAEIRAQDLRRELVLNKKALIRAETELQNRNKNFQAVIKQLAGESLNTNKSIQWHKLKTEQLSGLLVELKQSLQQTSKDIKQVKDKRADLLNCFRIEQGKIDCLQVRTKKLVGKELAAVEHKNLLEVNDGYITRKVLKERSENPQELTIIEAEVVTDRPSESVSPSNVPETSNQDPGPVAVQQQLRIDPDQSKREQRQLDNFQDHLDTSESKEQLDSWRNYIKQVFDAENFQLKSSDPSLSLELEWQEGREALKFEVSGAEDSGVIVKLLNSSGVSQSELHSLHVRLKHVLSEAGIGLEKFYGEHY